MRAADQATVLMRLASVALCGLLVGACAGGSAPTLQPTASSGIGVARTAPVSPPPTVRLTASPQTTPSPDATPSASANPTGTPKTGLGYDQVEGLDPSEVTLVPVPDGTLVGSPAFCGQEAVYDDRDGTEENFVNLQSGTVTRIAGPEHGVSFDAPVMSSDWIAWVSWRQAVKGNSGASTTPLRWTISAVPTSDPSATPIEIASGSNVGVPFPAYPTVAIDGDLVAYTIESPQPGHPEANSIVVHNLATGADVSQTQTDQSLYDLAVSGAAVLYTEGPLDEYGEWYDTRVMLAVNGGPSVRVAAHADEATMDGQRLVWEEERLDLDGIYSLRVMTATLANMEPQQLSRQSTQAQAYEGYWPAAGEDLVSWWERGRRGGPDADLVVWDPLTGATVPIFATGSMTFSGLCGGWVGWQSGVESPPGNALEAFYDAPLDAVRRLFQ